MRLLTSSTVLTTLLALALPALATDPSSTTTAPTTLITPSPHLEARQAGIGLVDPAAAASNIAAAGPVTNYEIGGTAVVYTQTFANVPDQWPSAKAGQIGYGDLQRRSVERREAEAKPLQVEEARILGNGMETTGTVLQGVVLQMLEEVVVVPVRKVTSVIIVETVMLGNNSIAAAHGNGTVMANMGFGTGRPSAGFFGTAAASASLGNGTFGPLYTGTA